MLVHPAQRVHRFVRRHAGLLAAVADRNGLFAAHHPGVRPAAAGGGVLHVVWLVGALDEADCGAVGDQLHAGRDGVQFFLGQQRVQRVVQRVVRPAGCALVDVVHRHHGALVGALPGPVLDEQRRDAARLDVLVLAQHDVAQHGAVVHHFIGQYLVGALHHGAGGDRAARLRQFGIVDRIGKRLSCQQGRGNCAGHQFQFEFHQCLPWYFLCVA